MAAAEPRRRVRMRVRGRVQGVGFRESTRREAATLGLRGSVRNCIDGSVEVLAEGPAGAIGSLVAWCREGPPPARVDSVDVLDEPTEPGAGGFAILG